MHTPDLTIQKTWLTDSNPSLTHKGVLTDPDAHLKRKANITWGSWKLTLPLPGPLRAPPVSGPYTWLSLNGSTQTTLTNEQDNAAANISLSLLSEIFTYQMTEMLNFWLWPGYKILHVEKRHTEDTLNSYQWVFNTVPISHSHSSAYQQQNNQ